MEPELVTPDSVIPDGGYGTADVARMLDLSPDRIRALAHAGLVAPARGPRGEHRFSFADLIVLRTARDLLEAGIPFARVRASLRNLQASLPEDRPLTGVRIIADGQRVVVHDSDALWDAESSQTLFDFRVVDLAEQIAPLAREPAEDRRPERELEAADWFEIGCDLELTCPDEARDAYRRGLEIDPEHADTHVNLGRLLHEIGDVGVAERHYRQALSIRPTDLTALFNLGVALEDAGRLREASLAYREALLADPDHADAHFNLAGVLERTGQKEHALRHLKAYRQLISERSQDTDDGSA